MNILHTLQEDYQAAAREYREGIERCYPKDMPVRAMLQHGQKYPSEGTVLCVDGDGRVALRLASLNRSGRNTVKRVHWTNILTPPLT
jgi:hypothetical protein